MIDFGAIIGAASAVVAFIVWLVRLEGRVNTETRVREEQIAGVVKAQEAQATANRMFEARIYEILERIEDKLDRKLDRP